jgi:hypothetical protein
MRRLRGKGPVEVKGRTIGSVDYIITVWQEAGGIKSAEGTAIEIEGTVLQQVVNEGFATLHLQSGGTVKFQISLLNEHGAEIQITGPIPGF